MQLVWVQRQLFYKFIITNLIYSLMSLKKVISSCKTIYVYTSMYSTIYVWNFRNLRIHNKFFIHGSEKNISMVWFSSLDQVLVKLKHNSVKRQIHKNWSKFKIPTVNKEVILKESLLLIRSVGHFISLLWNNFFFVPPYITLHKIVTIIVQHYHKLHKKKEKKKFIKKTKTKFNEVNL